MDPHGTLLIGLLCAAVPSAGDPPVRWGARTLKLAELPADLPEAGRHALETWDEWCVASGYRMELDAAARVLLITHPQNGRNERQMELAHQVIERFDRELPAPAERRVVPPPGAAPSVAQETPEPAAGRPPIPEDPEGEGEDDHPWKLRSTPAPQPETRAVTVTRWGLEPAPLDAQTITLLVVRNERDFRSLLAFLRKQYPDLETWSRSAKSLQGFVLPQPLAGCYVELAEGQEEWDPEHELVSRAARACLLRRFRELPNWITLGYAWHMEMALFDSVYCFPWRSEFVWATEHGAWRHEVGRRFESGELEPDFLGWRRGTYLNELAQNSWGMTEYLLAKQPEALPELLEELRAFIEEHALLSDGPGSWRRDTDYQMPAADQQRILEQRLGPGWTTRAARWLGQELERR